MSTNPIPIADAPGLAPADALNPNSGAGVSVEDLLLFLQTHGSSNAAIYNLIYEKVDAARFNQLYTRIERVEAAQRPADGTYTVGSWRSRQSDTKARIFEELVGLFLRASKPFQAYNRLNTPTNEIDWLVVFGPLQNTVPSFREWGPHFICECKFTKGNVKSEWVGKLNTLLQTHGACVAILISHKVIQGSRGEAAQAKRLAQDLSIMENPKFILSISFDDLNNCVATNQNFIHMLNLRYTELRSRINRLKLLIN